MAFGDYRDARDQSVQFILAQFLHTPQLRQEVTESARYRSI
jgi:hypothetical protein